MTEIVKTGITERLQPWQALFGLLTYVVGAFDISQANVLVLIGFLVATLGFVQRTNYKHKEAIKEVVAPWVLERLLKVLDEYLPEEEEKLRPEDIEIANLKAKIALMEEEAETEE